MKRLLLLATVFWAGLAFGQHELSYQSYMKGVAHDDKPSVSVLESNGQLRISNLGENIGNPIPGYAESVTWVDYTLDSVYSMLHYEDGNYYSSYPLTNSDVVFSEEGTEKILGYPCKKYKTSINSNTIEVWMTEKLGFDANPMPGLGRLKGVMVRCMRNGAQVTDLIKVNKKKTKPSDIIPTDKGQRMNSRELSQLRKDKLVIRIPVFDDEQIHFADYEPYTRDLPFDTTIHFSHGTIIVKRLQLPKLPEHYQLFAELHQRSNGDAYDRTASVFVIPTETS
nr:DUF4412 domain-containing protein [Bacteroidales bacterium]